MKVHLSALLQLLTAALLPLLLMYYGLSLETVTGCERWVAPPPVGNDSNPGTADLPWASMKYASEAVPDDHCLIWFQDGSYDGEQRLNRRFTTPTTFRAANAYYAIIQNAGPVVSISGATNLALEGFIFQHSSPLSEPLVVQVDGSEKGPAEQITLRDNIFRDSYNNDLLKILTGARFVVVENNVFYNQGGTDEHIDVNSVTDVVIQDNIFFNDFAGSGREVSQESHSFITVKDSNEGVDGLEGSERIDIRRNIFLNWEGGRETFIQVGNDGKPYHEAKDVDIENNLFIGNSKNDSYAIIGLRGARDVVFANNTVVGDLPSSAYAVWADLKDANPVNENIAFYNNIWSDPTGSMGSYYGRWDDNEFSKGNRLYIFGLSLDNNLYWNGNRPVPGGQLMTPEIDDPRGRVADPLLNLEQEDLVLPRWDRHAFLSGSRTIRQEFLRLVELYGELPAGSPAIGVGDPALSPADDILRRKRSATPELGAFEYQVELKGTSRKTTIELEWSKLNETAADSLRLTVTGGDRPLQLPGIPPTAREYRLVGLQGNTTYTIQLAALDAAGNVLVESNAIELATTHRWCLPLILQN